MMETRVLGVFSVFPFCCLAVLLFFFKAYHEVKLL